MKIIALIKSLLLIYLLFGLSVYFFQRSMIYHPTSVIEHPYETLKINHKDVMLEALVTNEEADKVIVYFGGNAENVAYTAADFEQQFPQHKTYLLKYRGYSGAAGDASEANLFKDALALIDHVKQDATHITVVGRSLGSGIATFVATERAIKQLVLVTPFDSIRSIAEQMLPFLPVKWLLKDHYDSESRAHKLKSATLVLAATNDHVITANHTQSLIQSIPKNLLTVTSIEAGHNDLDLKPEYFHILTQFILSE
ncbi:MAG: alpha/beta hydrolase [Marinicella sp.]